MQLDATKTIARTELVAALYDSRKYIGERSTALGANSTLAKDDDPFTSTKFANVKCEFIAQGGPLLTQQLTYEEAGDVVQGLMDYTFYPFTPSIPSISFAVNHDSTGFIGSGALIAVPGKVTTS